MKNGWSSHKFCEVFDLQMGRTPSRDNSDYWNGENLWVSISDMGSSKYIESTRECITDLAITEAKMPVIPANIAIMSFKLSIGKTAITSFPICTNEAIMAFIPKSGICVSPEYLYYYLSHYKWEGNRAAMGNTINKKIISDAIVSYPTIEVQQSIVSELDLINELIAKKKAQLLDLDSLAQSLFYEMFGDPVENEKGWEVKKLEETGRVINGYAFPSKDFSSKNDINVIKITNVGVNEFVNDDSSLPEKYSIKTDYMVKTGDIVIALTRTIISTGVKRAIVPESYNNALINQRVAAIVVNKKVATCSYVYTFLGTNHVRNYILAHATALMQPNLSINDLKSLPLPLPPLSLQQTFASRIEAIEEEKQKIQSSLKDLETLLAARMQYWFE